MNPCPVQGRKEALDTMVQYIRAISSRCTHRKTDAYAPNCREHCALQVSAQCHLADHKMSSAGNEAASRVNVFQLPPKAINVSNEQLPAAAANDGDEEEDDVDAVAETDHMTIIMINLSKHKFESS